MKHLTLAALFATLLIASCKKSDNNTTATPANTWKVGGVSHTVGNYQFEPLTISVFDKSGASIDFTFGTYPTASGSYDVVSAITTVIPGDHQVKIVAGDGNVTNYFSTGSDHTKASIQVVNGKLNIALPDSWAKRPYLDDSVKVSADLHQF